MLIDTGCFLMAGTIEVSSDEIALYTCLELTILQAFTCHQNHNRRD